MTLGDLQDRIANDTVSAFALPGSLALRDVWQRPEASCQPPAPPSDHVTGPRPQSSRQMTAAETARAPQEAFLKMRSIG